MSEDKKTAVVFPGIGYHADKPLLYYSKKLAAAAGYQVIDVPYGHFESGIKGNKEKMEKAFFSALEQTEEILRDVQLTGAGELLFLSKSIGTAVAAVYAKKHSLATRNIYFTPVEQTFGVVEPESGIVFHGTADPWVQTMVVQEACKRLKLPLFITEGANHSMETGVVDTDLNNMRQIMKQCEDYIQAMYTADRKDEI